MLGHDLSYLLEVLAISDGETEDELDERLREEARGLGLMMEDGLLLEEEAEDQPKSQEQDRLVFRPYFLDSPRRSASIDSRNSYSTGLTSTYSGLSKESAQYYGQRRSSHASLSFRDYDAFLSRGRPDGTHSLSFSPLSTPDQSTFSLSLSQPSSPDSSSKKHFRHIRALGRWKLRPPGSNLSPAEACPHCPLDTASRRRSIHKLSCGHRLCTQALRNTVNAATKGKLGAIPSCCGRPIPGSLVEDVMSEEEQCALLEKLERWDEAVSITHSLNSSRRDSLVPVPYVGQAGAGAFSHRSRPVSEDSQTAPSPGKRHEEVDKSMVRDEYALLLTGQSNQRDRFVRWSEKQRHELEARHESSRETTRAQHETAVEEMTERHVTAVAEAEDKQVRAESEMRKTQEQETRDNVTALKHMEAYCAGRYGSGEQHNRTVTDQAFAELDKARRASDQMDAKHESQINVLRGEQGRRLRLRAQRQDRELQDLQHQQLKTELELERACSKELAELEDSIANKQRKILWRWELQTAIFTLRVNSETDMRFESCLPTAEWSGKDRNSLQIAARTVDDYECKHGVVHSCTVPNTPRHSGHFEQGHFKIGG